MNCPMCNRLTGWTPQQTRILDLLISGVRWGELPQKLGLAPRTVKAHLNRMYLMRGISGKGSPLVRLVTDELYHRNPELVPFNDGDRAMRVGKESAATVAKLKQLQSDRLDNF